MTKASAGWEKTLPLTVHNTGFLLDRMGGDCHPLQFLRELSQNSIESIIRSAANTGDVIWDVDWNYLDLYGYFKLSIIDNGEGMTGAEMVKYINQLSSSGAEQSFIGNYGVGAKIAAATRNHEGLLYLSWKGGKGSMIHLWREPVSGQYGLRQFERPDGTYGHFADIEDDVKPALIKQHGTMVVLLGNSEDENTMIAPEGAPSPSMWVAKYLNTRYFKFPEGVTVKARQGWHLPRTNTDSNILRTVTGQEQYLRKHSIASGSVELTGASARWWILQDNDTISQNSGWVESAGHIAALHKDELYELSNARAGMAKLQQFGVLLGHRRVVIYVEPLQIKGRVVTTNTARTLLLINNEPLPWAEWAAEFREGMPAEIQQMMDEYAAGSSSSDHSKSIRERLKHILDLYKASRYKPTPDGAMLIDPDALTRGGKSKQREHSGEGTSSRPGGKGGAAGGLYSVFLKKDGVPGDEIQPEVFPDVHWISVKDKTREHGDLEDRAARFHADQNVLMINADFRVFIDMINKWRKEFGNTPAVTEIVTDAVHNWFEQSLVETVIGIQALQNSQEWTSIQVEKALSEEALTAAVMPRYHVNNSVKRELGSKLGKIQAA
jgi:hypothetical protein